jgi:predicted RNA-binding protein YlxR (DUF448 family)
VVLDPSGRVPGRGAYLCNDPACIATATRRRSLEHALGVAIPVDILAAAAAPTTDDAPGGDPHGQE